MEPQNNGCRYPVPPHLQAGIKPLQEARAKTQLDAMSDVFHLDTSALLKGLAELSAAVRALEQKLNKGAK